jgi:ubiquitin carboxyl-terminal hydrolase 1
MTDSIAVSSTLPPSPRKSKPSQTKKKKYKEVKKMEQRIRAALEEGRIEDESLMDGVKLEKVVSPASTKQAMIARVSQMLSPLVSSNCNTTVSHLWSLRFT